MPNSCQTLVFSLLDSFSLSWLQWLHVSLRLDQCRTLWLDHRRANCICSKELWPNCGIYVWRRRAWQKGLLAILYAININIFNNNSQKESKDSKRKEKVKGFRLPSTEKKDERYIFCIQLLHFIHLYVFVWLKVKLLESQIKVWMIWKTYTILHFFPFPFLKRRIFLWVG